MNRVLIAGAALVAVAAALRAPSTVTIYTTDPAGRPKAIEIVLVDASGPILERRTIDTRDWDCPMAAPCTIPLTAGAIATVIIAPTIVVQVRR